MIQTILTTLAAHPLIVSNILLSAALVIVGVGVILLYRRWRKTFGPNATESESAAQSALMRLNRLEERFSRVEPRISALEKIGNIAVQKVGFLRFNPFEDTGGSQSFSIVLLDQENNGIVLSSLYTREGVRVYAKEVARGTPQHPLSAEERQVLAQAMHATHESTANRNN